LLGVDPPDTHRAVSGLAEKPRPANLSAQPASLGASDHSKEKEKRKKKEKKKERKRLNSVP
jgi:hypothetical protein